MGNAKRTTMQVGLFNIPVRLEVAVDDESSDTHTVCTGDGAHEPTRVKNHVDCPTCGKTATSVWGYPERGVEIDGKIVVVTAEELRAAGGEPIKSLNLGFHSREKVYAATVAGDSVQYVTPDKGGERGYQALVDFLSTHPDLVAAAIWAPSSRNALWVIEAGNGHLVASKRAWPENVRVAPAIPPAEVGDAEAAMFAQLIEATVTDFDLGVYRDAAKEGLAALLATRYDSAVVVATPGAPAAPAGDMLAALQASLAAAKPSRSATKRVAKKAPAKPKKGAAA